MKFKHIISTNDVDFKYVRLKNFMSENKFSKVIAALTIGTTWYKVVFVNYVYIMYALNTDSQEKRL